MANKISLEWILEGRSVCVAYGRGGLGFSTTTSGLYSLDSFCNSASSSADAIEIEVDLVTDGADGADDVDDVRGRMWYDS